MVKVLELFGGIGACTKAFKRLGIDYEVVDYVEIDKYAVKSYNAINNTNVKIIIAFKIKNNLIILKNS